MTGFNAETEVAVQTRVHTRTRIVLAIGMIHSVFIGAAMAVMLLPTKDAAATLAPADTVSPFVQTVITEKPGEPTGVIIETIAMDSQGINSVWFYIDGKLQYVDRNAAGGWSLTWNTDDEPSSHLIDVAAVDTSGNVGWSERQILSLPLTPVDSTS
ncbi:MAG: Ig-like domain-containing protein [Patescibacteria group bacterium]